MRSDPERDRLLLELTRLERENRHLREELREARAIGPIVGRSHALRGLREQISTAALTDASVLIHGEVGTERESIARAIHEGSPRRDGPLTGVRCSVPLETFETDLRNRAALAEGGALYLDEVSVLTPEAQAALMRFVEGSPDAGGPTDVRLIAATRRDLRREVAEGRFDRELYFRLAVFQIEVAPLRRRVEDIPLIASQLLDRLSRRLGRPPPKLGERHVRLLMTYSWPGNVSELRNVLERAVLTSRGRTLRIKLPRSRRDAAGANPEILTYEELKEIERRSILAVLRMTDWKISGPGGAAQILGVKATTLASRLKAMGIERPE